MPNNIVPRFAASLCLGLIGLLAGVTIGRSEAQPEAQPAVAMQLSAVLVGTVTQNGHVTFARPFASKPYVVSALGTLDSGDRTQCGWDISNVSATGFDMTINKGNTGGCYGSRGMWIATSTGPGAK